MTLNAFLDYGLLIVFFILLAGILVLMAKPPLEIKTSKEALVPTENKVMAYVILAIMIAFFILLTLFSKKERLRMSSAQIF